MHITLIYHSNIIKYFIYPLFTLDAILNAKVAVI